MGSAVAKEKLWDDDQDTSGPDDCQDISAFEHSFAANIEDFTPGLLPSVEPASDSSNRACSGRAVTVEMMMEKLVVREAVRMKENILLSVPYEEIHQLTWDHAQSSLKLRHGGHSSDSVPDYTFICFRVENSLDLELELKLRAKAAIKRGRKLEISSFYLGIFAGPTKPKPFQRKRPNLALSVPEGELPSLLDMRRWALEENAGSASPVPSCSSLRPKLALGMIYQGENRFPLSVADGVYNTGSSSDSGRGEGELVMNFSAIKVQMTEGGIRIIPYDDIKDWAFLDLVGTRSSAVSGLKIWMANGKNLGIDVNNEEGGDGNNGLKQNHIYLGIPDDWLLLARNSMEFFWNRHRADQYLLPKAGSILGRPVASVITLTGEVVSPNPLTGLLNAIDLDGSPVRVGQVLKRSGHLHLSPRSLLGVEKKQPLKSNATAKSTWERIVLHQGWLRKRGGGALKRWLWRYFVIFSTCQGHFLAYYADVCDIPLFSTIQKERRFVDLCQVCFIRPETNRESRGIPPHAFTLVTMKRQWTLSADSQAGVQKWLMMLSRAVDEDVAVVTDDEMIFEVFLYVAVGREKTYRFKGSATAHIGSRGMKLELEEKELGGGSGSIRAQPWAGDTSEMPRIHFWSYTDFFNWSVVKLSESGTGLRIKCFTDATFENKQDMTLVTSQASQLAIAIEHHIEKFMAFMHLRLETSQGMATAHEKYRLEKIYTGQETAVDEKTCLQGQPQRNMKNISTEKGEGGKKADGDTNGFGKKMAEGSEMMKWVEDPCDTDLKEVTAALALHNPFQVVVGPSVKDNALDGYGAPKLTLTGGGTTGERINPFDQSDSSEDDGNCGELKSRTIGVWEDMDSHSYLSAGDITTFFPDDVPADTENTDTHHPFSTPGAPALRTGPPLPTKPVPPAVNFELLLMMDGLDQESPKDPGKKEALFFETVKDILPGGCSTTPSTPEPSPIVPQALPFSGGVGEIVGQSFPTIVGAPSQSKPLPQLAATMGPPSCQVWELSPPDFARTCPGAAGQSTSDFCPFADPDTMGMPGGDLNPGEGLGMKVIYSSPDLKVTVENSKKESDGRYMLTLLYERPPSALSTANLTTSLHGECVSTLKASFQPKVISARLGPNTDPVRHTLSLRCIRPFCHPPQLSLLLRSPPALPPRRKSSQQLDSSPQDLRVDIPLVGITMSSFVQAIPETADSFRRKWSGLSAPAQSAQTTVLVANDLFPGNTFRSLAHNMGLAEVSGVGEDTLLRAEGSQRAKLVAAAGCLHTATRSVSGEEVTVDCLVGVEVSHATFTLPAASTPTTEGSGVPVRVTVKSVNHTFADCLLQEIVAGLRAGKDNQ